TVQVIDVATMSIVGQIEPGGDVNTLLMHPSGAELYVEVFCVYPDYNCTQPGEVAVVDTATNAVRATVPVDHRPQSMALDRRGRNLCVRPGRGAAPAQTGPG